MTGNSSDTIYHLPLGDSIDRGIDGWPAYHARYRITKAEADRRRAEKANAAEVRSERVKVYRKRHSQTGRVFEDGS